MSTSGARTVLIVDDSEPVRRLLSELFEREGDVSVCGEAVNGKEAIDKARKLHPDLVVLDLSMPVMNGLQAARILRRMMPTVPLIMYSAYGDRFVAHQAQLIGIAEVVSKSEHASVLVRKARKLLSSTSPQHPAIKRF